MLSYIFLIIKYTRKVIRRQLCLDITKFPSRLDQAHFPGEEMCIRDRCCVCVCVCNLHEENQTITDDEFSLSVTSVFSSLINIIRFPYHVSFRLTKSCNTYKVFFSSEI